MSRLTSRAARGVERLGVIGPEARAYGPGSGSDSGSGWWAAGSSDGALVLARPLLPAGTLPLGGSPTSGRARSDAPSGAASIPASAGFLRPCGASGAGPWSGPASWANRSSVSSPRAESGPRSWFISGSSGRVRDGSLPLCGRCYPTPRAESVATCIDQASYGGGRRPQRAEPPSPAGDRPGLATGRVLRPVEEAAGFSRPSPPMRTGRAQLLRVRQGSVRGHGR